MKIVVQRVSEAKVSVEDKVLGVINQGLLLYVCFETGDSHNQIDHAVEKILNLRIFNDDEGRMNLNLKQAGGKILSISQFTLSWNGKKGHRPSFDKSMAPNQAKIFYRRFNDNLAAVGLSVEKGRFGAEMKISAINDGPVTFHFDF